MKKIEAYVALVERSLQEQEFSGKPAGLYDPIVYFMQLGGKRLRPALCLAACEMFGQPATQALPPALAIEIFHNFTLVHDDIMDEAAVRRGKPTVHRKWDLNTAILSGDTMLVKSYQLLSQVEGKILKPVLDTFSQTAIEVCEGQQYDLAFESEAPVKEEDYIKMIRLKTSVLLGAALKIGALTGGASEEDAARIYRFGVNTGIAFQIQDDLLDAFGNPEKVGKKPGGDIIQNKQTLLRIFAWHQGGDAARSALERSYDGENEKVSATLELFEKCGARSYVEKKRDDYLEMALKSLDAVKGDEEIRRELSQFAQWLISRDY